MNAFIDCGAYKGKLIEQFRANARYGSAYKVYALECNPALSHVHFPGTTEIRKAAWIFDGELEFFINTKVPRIQGNSVYRDKTTGHLDKEHPVKVPCFDFSKWLSETFTAEDYVVIKMNIEGAEYDVLEKCIVDGTISLINELHIQWHWMKIPGVSRERHDNLVRALNRVNGLNVYNGYGRIKG